jgi:phage tail-like protein
MSVTTVEAKNRAEPLIGAGFAVQLGDTVAGWFTECNGLAVEREVKHYPEGGVNDFVHQLPGPIKRSKITLKHGLAGNELWDWFQTGAYDGQVERRNVSIVLYDAALNEVGRWDLTEVYPAKWSGSAFNGAKNEVMIETVEFVQGASADEVSTLTTVQRATTGANNPATVPQIDVTALTRKIYALLKHELKLERDRLGRP